VRKLSGKSEILIQSVSIEIEIITKRIFAIKNSFYQTNNINLRKRLSNEYFYLFNKFIDLRSKVFLFKKLSNEKLSYSSILHEKYKRCEKLIFHNNNLFFV
tara:strand:+ start:16 stop:318 length:303 start_codon:yes stop_codon:yes gene_type:complete